MKRITSLLFFMSTLWGFAQVKNYTFTPTAGSYQEISGGTLLGTVTSDDQIFVDAAVPEGSATIPSGPGLNIGFNFAFNGFVYDKFAIANDGWISLGSSTLSPSVNAGTTSTYTPLLANQSIVSDACNAKIAAFANNLQAQTGSSLRFQTIGTAPNRVLVVQWKAYKNSGSIATGDSYNFQIRLNEATSTVDFVYGTFVSHSGTDSLYEVGMRGGPSNDQTNFTIRKSATGWDQTTASIDNKGFVEMTDNYKPYSGLTYTWTPLPCGGPTALVVGNTFSDSASFSWSAFIPFPSSYEYNVSTLTALPVGAGTPAAATSATATGLNPDTVYNVFVRSVCGSKFSAWALLGTLKTRCADVTSIYENFDTTSNVNLTLPDCWDNTGTTGSSYVINTGTNPISAPNALRLVADSKVVDGITVAYAVLPPVSNLHAGSNQLRFKAYAESTGGTLDFGYFTDVNNAGSFMLLQTLDLPATVSKAALFIIPPGVLPVGVKNLVFRNTGNPTTPGIVKAYIDDLVWEPITTCQDVSALVAKGNTDTSVKLSWTASPSKETLWEYVYGLPTVTNPTTLNPVQVNAATATVTGLQPQTQYKAWVRSKCSSTSVGSWMGPVYFTTTCPMVTEFAQDFDGSSSLPSCWTTVTTSGYVAVSGGGGTAPSFPNVLNIRAASLSDYAIVAMPPVSNYADGSHELRFKIRSSTANAKIQIGYLTDIADPGTFTTLIEYTPAYNPANPNAFSVFDPHTFGSLLKSPYLAFRNSGQVSSTFYIDDVVWEPIPSCQGISGLSVITTAATSLELAWSGDNQGSGWQYVKADPSVSYPSGLTPVDVASSDITISNLSPSTTYKIWVRSKCSATTFGSWSDPIRAKTSCSTVTQFSENFDNVPVHTLPSCWNGVGNSPAAIDNNTYFSLPAQKNLLSLSSSLNGGATVLALPAVSNAGNGTHRLTMKIMATQAGAPLEVGYLISLSDPKSFVPLMTYTASAPNKLTYAAFELGMDPASSTLAIRNPGGSLTTFYIDEVIWEAVPACPNVSNVVPTANTSTSIDFSWTGSGTEHAWQYVYTPSPTADPNSLMPVSVTVANGHLTNLTPGTVYNIWVRSDCGSQQYGIWIGPLTISTACAAVTSFSENFDSSYSMPSCWVNVGNQGQVIIAIDKNGPSSPNALYINSFAASAPAVVAMPPVSNIPAGTNMLKFKFRGDTAGAKVEVGFVTSLTDPNTFTPYQTFTATSSTHYDVAWLDMGQSPLSQILAFRNPGAPNYAVYIDDVVWTAKPTAVPSCASGFTATLDPKCGTYATAISWAPAAGADLYLLSIGTTSGGTQILSNLNIGADLSYSYAGNSNTTYYYTVTPKNILGAATGCAEQSFTTIAQGCYCISNPAVVDGSGVVNVQLGGAVFADTNPTYNDFTARQVNLARGVQSNLKITFDTATWSYGTTTYIDYNDNYVFENSEIAFSGTSGTAVPNTVNASFTVPANANLGNHRMRIASWYGDLPVDPCYNGNRGVTLDFNVKVVNAIANDTPAGAIALTTGADFAANSIAGTNVDATGSVAEPAPGCGAYQGDDVWYYALVPSSGNLAFEVNSVSGGLTNTAGAVYSGTPSSLTLLACDDSSSTAGNDNPKVNVSGRTAGEKLYFRVWDNGGSTFGNYQVAAYKGVLGVDIFEINNFSYYPNPVNDVLNLSFDQNIDSVVVFNLLGQQVLVKNIDAAQGNVDMSTLSKGTYLVKVTAADQVKTIKVFKD